MEKICTSKPSSSSSESQSRWSKLPLNILILIAEKLSPTSDYLVFSSVCRSWRSAAGKSNYPPSRQMPWLILQESESKTGNRHLFNPADQTVYYNLDLPEFRGTRLVGSTDGWLVTLKKNTKIQILNPMSRRHVSLPDTSSPIVKVCLSPGAPTSCSAMAIYGLYHQLGIAWPGDKVWTRVESNRRNFLDVIYFNGAFHAVNIQGYVVYCDIAPDDRSVEVIRLAPPVSDRFDGTWIKHLVECSGSLLQVLRCIETLRVEVFRWRVELQEWEEVRDLGDVSIFLGCNSSFSVSASGAVGCRRNCIYFADSYDDGYCPRKYMEVYDMENKTNFPLCPSSMSIWIQPTLWRAC